MLVSLWPGRPRAARRSRIRAAASTQSCEMIPDLLRPPIRAQPMGAATVLLLLLPVATAINHLDTVCTTEYAPKCPFGWHYTPDRRGTCVKPRNSSSHCDSPFNVDGWDAEKKYNWENLCKVMPGWPTARCPLDWQHSVTAGGRCDAPAKQPSHCSPVISVDRWSRLQKLAWQRTCGPEWVCAGMPATPPAPVPPSPPPAPVPVPGYTRATITATAAHDLQYLFQPQPPWLGADCATSMELPRGRVLWIHQDTLVGSLVHHPDGAVGFDTRQQHCMPHNSVALMERVTARLSRGGTIAGEAACALKLERVCCSANNTSSTDAHDRQRQTCEMCCSQHQKTLRGAGCTPFDCAVFCNSRNERHSWNLTHFVRGECTAQWCMSSSTASCSADPEALGARANGFFAPRNASRWYWYTLSIVPVFPPTPTKLNIVPLGQD
eukprot:SAG31_NODE_2716_length_5201_cov_2.881419_2_plen_436_part_00